MLYLQMRELRAADVNLGRHLYISNASGAGVLNFQKRSHNLKFLQCVPGICNSQEFGGRYKVIRFQFALPETPSQTVACDVL